MHWSLWIAIFGLCLGIGGYGIYCMVKPEEASANLIDSPEEVQRKGCLVTVVCIIAVIVAVICLITGSCSGCGLDGSESSSGPRTCSSCGKTFKENSKNAESIKNSSMCTDCYGDFQWRQEVQDYIDNQPIY